MSKIVIDLGHGVGSDRGAVGVIAEETIINNVGSLVIDKLRALGNEVLTVRPSSASSVENSLEQRVNASNNFGADLFVCIHANAGGGQGTEVFTYNGKELSYARNILNNLVALGFRNRGIKSESLYVINHTDAESLLLEICFVDTQSDVDLYYSLGDEKIADAIVKGIVGQTVTVSPTINTQPAVQATTPQSPIQKAKEFVGNRCLELQQKLNKAFNCGLSEDNNFGQLTYEALGESQLKLGIACDYMAGNQTFNALDNYIADKNKSQSVSDNWVLQLQKELNNQSYTDENGNRLAEDGMGGKLTLSACPTLKIGCQGEITRLLQTKIGAYADSDFGNGTSSILATWQIQNGLVGDSICGRLSWSKLLGLS